MRLSRDELKEISAGATAVEYGSFLKALIAKIIAFIVNLLNGGSTGGGGGGGEDPPPDDGGGGGEDPGPGG